MKSLFTSSIKLFCVFTLIALLGGEIYAQWSANSTINTPIVTAAGYQLNQEVISDGANGVITIWRDNRGGTYHLYIQRLDGNGVAQWAADGIQITTATPDVPHLKLISDGAGGAIVVWQDQRTDNDIYAQRIDAAGNVLWAADGVPVCIATNNQTAPDITNTSDGVIIAWTDQRNGGANTREVGVYAQRLDMNGVAQWTTNGELVIDVAQAQDNVRLVPDGSDGAIAVMDDESNTYTYRITSRRINSAGVAQGAASGVQMTTATGFPQYLYNVTSDGGGGVIAVWNDSRNAMGVEYYTQRLDNTGARLWDAAGVRLVTGSFFGGTCELVSDGAGGAIYTYNINNFPTDQRIFVQRVDNTGSILWAPNGVLLSNPATLNETPMIAPTSTGGAIVSWWYRSSAFDIHAQKVDASGVPQWAVNGIVISDNAANQYPPTEMVSDGAGGAIITFNDLRNSPQHDLYAQQVSSDGSLGTGTAPSIGPAVPVLATPVDGATAQSVTPVLTWNSVATATSYRIQLAEDAGFSSVLTDTVTAALSYSVYTPLNNYASYFWRVKSFHATDSSTFSTEFTFRTQIAAPVLIAPAHLSPGNSIHPLLVWYTVDGADNYRIQFSADPAFATTMYDSVLTDTTMYIDSILANDTLYYWRAYAENANPDVSPWSGRTLRTVTEVIPYLTHPIANALVYTLDPIVFWNINVSGVGISYDVQYSVDSLFPAAMTTTQDGGAAISDTIAGLTPATRYFWRVRSKNTNAIISYSVTESFTTYGEVNTVPTASWPIGGTTVYTVAPTLYWYLGLSSFNYAFDVRFKESSSGVWLGPVNVGSSLSLPLSGLTAGTSYDWAVRSMNGADTSDWTATQTFETYGSTSTTPVTPVISYPLNGVMAYTLTPTLYWYIMMSHAGFTFNVEVYTDTLESAVHAASGITDIYYQAPVLLPGTTYYFRVQTDNGSSQSAWTYFASFETFGVTGDIQPILSFPIDGQIIYANTATLYWYMIGSADTVTYELQFKANDSSFSSTINLDSTSYAVSSLIAGTTYYWRVRSFNGNAFSGWTNAESFTVTGNAGTLVPILSWPVGGAAQTTTVDLHWYVNGLSPTISYQVQYASESDFSNAVTVVAPTTTTQLTGLVAGTIYYWKVRSYNGTVYSAFSNTETFATYAGSAPVRPRGGSPVNNVLLTTNSVEISWFLPVQATGLTYELQYSVNNDFTNAVTVQNIQGTSYIANALPTGASLYWRVRSKTGNEIHSAYSKVEQFIPNTPTGIGQEAEIPTEFALGQNYPNPFNPATMINFSLPLEVYVSIKIYDMLGREVKTLLAEIKESGFYSIKWNGDNGNGEVVAAGSYIYRITAGSFIQTKKMIFLK